MRKNLGNGENSYINRNMKQITMCEKENKAKGTNIKKQVWLENIVLTGISASGLKAAWLGPDYNT